MEKVASGSYCCGSKLPYTWGLKATGFTLLRFHSSETGAGLLCYPQLSAGCIPQRPLGTLFGPWQLPETACLPRLMALFLCLHGQQCRAESFTLPPQVLFPALFHFEGSLWLHWSHLEFQDNLVLNRMIQFSRSVVSDPLRPHGPQHTRPPCPSPTPGACSNSHHLHFICYLNFSFPRSQELGYGHL